MCILKSMVDKFNLQVLLKSSQIYGTETFKCNNMNSAIMSMQYITVIHKYNNKNEYNNEIHKWKKSYLLKPHNSLAYFVFWKSILNLHVLLKSLRRTKIDFALKFSKECAKYTERGVFNVFNKNFQRKCHKNLLEPIP